jgi:hypothetical protein
MNWFFEIKKWGWRAFIALSPVFQERKMKMENRNIHDTDYQNWLDTTQQDFPWEENEIEKLESIDTTELIASLKKLQKLIKKGGNKNDKK